MHQVPKNFRLIESTSHLTKYSLATEIAPKSAISASSKGGKKSSSTSLITPTNKSTIPLSEILNPLYINMDITHSDDSDSDGVNGSGSNIEISVTSTKLSQKRIRGQVSPEKYLNSTSI